MLMYDSLVLSLNVRSLIGFMAKKKRKLLGKMRETYWQGNNQYVLDGFQEEWQQAGWDFIAVIQEQDGII